MLNKAQVTAIKARAEKATPGPWYREGPLADWELPPDGAPVDIVVDDEEEHPQSLLEDLSVSDADLIAAARDDVPALCATVEALLVLVVETHQSIIDDCRDCNMVTCAGCWIIKKLEAVLC